MSSSGQPEGNERRASARADFHLALATVLAPVLALPLEWLLALRQRGRRADDGGEGIWARRLWRLALFDTLWAALLIASWLTGGARPASWAAPARPRIGIQLGAERADGVEVAKVEPGGPAARAGLQAGDLIGTVEGVAPARRERLQLLVGNAGAGQALRLVISREGKTLPLEVVPERPRATQRRLFDPAPDPRRDTPLLLELLQLGLTAAALVAAWLLSGRARIAALACAATAAGVIALALATAAVSYALPPSDGALALSALAGSSALLTVGALSGRALHAAGLLEREPEPPPPLRIALRGILYIYALGARVGLFALGAGALLGTSAGSELAGAPTRIAADLGPEGFLLFAAVAVVIAPVAEEILFRGLLLPALRSGGDARALWATAVVFAIGHLAYGWGAVTVLIIGGVLGWARLQGKGLGAPVLIHTSVNAIGVLALLLFRRM